MGQGNTLRKLVLASQSPRRLEILRQAGFRPEVRAANIREVREEGEEPMAYVQRLAEEKAKAISMQEGEVILGADTTVVVEGVVLEKPADGEEAAAMLRRLAGRQHEVLTGYCVRWEWKVETRFERTLVEFYPLENEEIEEYARSGEPLDKAGGYAIQGLASRFVKRIDGCFYNVVGLPIGAVGQVLRKAGIRIS